MNKVLLIALMGILVNVAWAQKFPVDTLVYHSLENGINLIIIPDGYTADNLPKFRRDALSFTNYFLDVQPFREYRQYFNIFTIEVPSEENGADHAGTATDVTEPAHPVSDVNNRFGSSFDFANIHRLVVAQNSLEIFNLLVNNFPLYDQTIVLVNSEYYGGSGGSFPVATTHASSNEIAIHELGHSFANLSDEYWAGDQFARESANMTKDNNPATVKWKNWLDYQNVGIFQHCCGEVANQWYKPHANCKMQVLGVPFCAVCTQGIIETIHQLVSPVDKVFPDVKTIISQDSAMAFSLNLIYPIPNTLNVSWQLNGETLKTQVDSITLLPKDLAEGKNILAAIIHDTTALLRVNQHEILHVYINEWEITKEVTTSIHPVTPVPINLDIFLFPNPAREKINIGIKNGPYGMYSFQWFALDGRKISAVRQLEMDEANNFAELDLPPNATGNAVLVIGFKNYRFSRMVTITED